MPAADPPTTTAKASPVANVPVATKEIDISDIIDLSTFEQIREMDDEDSDEFSRAIVLGFLEQAKETFDKMESSVKSGDLEQLSSLGHFLKGSSATLGLIKVKDHCERIQHFGGRKDETGTKDMPDDEKCLEAIEKSLKHMREEYEKVDSYFKKLYPPDECQK